jgi:L-galactose dehydrogenase
LKNPTLYLTEHFHLSYKYISYDSYKENDVELAKLAVWHSLQCTDIDTHLVGMQNSRELSINIDVVYNGINEKERELLDQIKEK